MDSKPILRGYPVNKKLSLTLVVLATSAIASAAQAAEQVRWPNWYVGVHGGMNHRADGDLRTTALGTSEVSSDTGYIVGASIGYLPPTTIPFFNNSRWELEFSYRANDNEGAAGGDITTLNYYGNLFYDFNNDSPWTPYLGAGLGYTNVDFDSALIGGDDTVLGWQLMAGLAYVPTSLPNTAWSLGYRYQTTFDDARFTDSVAASAGKIEIENHSVELGARFMF